ncbi:E3 ubiquitin-protein ligase Mdm2 [Anabrus simplex]|uniref:E3 ubiquitin-protein ligase Mdm2 n=1 Tax=Anabrus simplex TaxID=316456 RepID=UPI0035A3890C
MDGPVQSEASCSQLQVGISSSLPVCRKRANENACGDLDGESPGKRSKCQYYFVLASESELPTDEDTESEHSIQGKVTDFVKDTSDSDWTDSSSAVRVEYEEYEVASSSSDQPFFSSDSMSSATDDLIRTAGVIAAVIDEDLGLFADTSDSDSDPVRDPELRNDFWICVQCKNKNNNPLFRFCEKCWRLRKDFLPPRPQRRRSKKKSTPSSLPSNRNHCETDKSNLDNRSLEAASNLGSISAEAAKSLGNASVKAASNLDNRSVDAASNLDNRTVEAASNLNSRSVEAASDLNNRSAKFTSDIRGDSGYPCSEPGSPQASTSQQFPVSSEGPDLCITCVTRPKNGIFVHRTAGHICCCYECAVKVWKKLAYFIWASF